MGIHAPDEHILARVSVDKRVTSRKGVGGKRKLTCVSVAGTTEA